MFDNNLTLTMRSATGGETAVLVDGPTNRRTLRVSNGALPLEVSIAHQASSENPGTDSVRSVVRLAVTKVNAETGKDVMGYVQFVMLHPVSQVDITADDLHDLVIALLNFFTDGGHSSAAIVSSGDEAGISLVVDRLIQGES